MEILLEFLAEMIAAFYYGSVDDEALSEKRICRIRRIIEIVTLIFMVFLGLGIHLLVCVGVQNVWGWILVSLGTIYILLDILSAIVAIKRM